MEVNGSPSFRKKTGCSESYIMKHNVQLAFQVVYHVPYNYATHANILQ